MNATLYTYHGIQYTYADLQRAYIRRLDATEKAIDAGKYAEASEIIWTDVREYLPQIADRQQTGDKRTLTPHRKRGIIKAIRRHVRRWKRKQEGKTMKKMTVALLNTVKNALKTRVNGDKIDLYEIRFDYRGETFKITTSETPNHWRLLKLPYNGAYAFDEFAEFDYNPFK